MPQHLLNQSWVLCDVKLFNSPRAPTNGAPDQSQTHILIGCTIKCMNTDKYVILKWFGGAPGLLNNYSHVTRRKYTPNIKMLFNMHGRPNMSVISPWFWIWYWSGWERQAMGRGSLNSHMNTDGSLCNGVSFLYSLQGTNTTSQPWRLSIRKR